MCGQTWEELYWGSSLFCPGFTLGFFDNEQYGRIPSCFIIFDRHKHYRQTANQVNFQQAVRSADDKHTRCSLRSTVPIQHLMSYLEHRNSLPYPRAAVEQITPSAISPCHLITDNQRGAGYSRKDTWTSTKFWALLSTYRFFLVKDGFLIVALAFQLHASLWISKRPFIHDKLSVQIP